VPLGGPVQVARGGSWGTLVRPEDLAAGDMIRSEAGRAMLELADGGRLELAPHTTLRRPA